MVNVQMTVLCINDFNLHSVCAVDVLLNNEQTLDQFSKQLCL